jgi:exodeoxyribonuclease V alpha subunit
VNLAALPPLPAEFIRVVGRIVPRAGDVARIAAALVADATAAGHVCIDLEAVAGTTILDGAVAVPDLPALLAGLETDPLVAKPGGFAPLVLDGHRLYLHRYWHYETSLAAALVARAASFDERVEDLALQRALDRFFPPADRAPEMQAPDMQKVAAAVAALKRIAVLCGGPGTGKTTTAARVLAVLTALAGAERIAIGLAAPTGKAAARLQSALAAHPETASIAGQAVTLHRLLGLGAGRAPRYNAANPLPLDVLVVDEASMIDLALAAKLVDALPAHARLILLGDPEQLASVEAGAVLASIAGTATAYSPELAARLTRLTGQAVPIGAPVSALSDAIVRLGRSYRFAESGAIGRLAQAVREGNAEGAVATLDAGGDAAWLAPGMDALGDAAFAGYAGYFAAIDGGAEPARGFAELERFRVLAAVRDGPFGVHALNRAVERRRAARDASVAHQRWYPGRPVMVTRNDYAMRLANGDVGIVVRDASMSGGVAVAFAAPEGGTRRFSPARMPECETVYALTVHKSQGSEFDAVLIVLPRTGTAVLSRELIYTGITRARRRVTVLAQPDVLKAAIGMRVRRDSALSERLREPRSGASLAL